jgi:hypothetical protein
MLEDMFSLFFDRISLNVRRFRIAMSRRIISDQWSAIMAAAEDIGQNDLARSVMAEIFTSFIQFSPEKDFT